MESRGGRGADGPVFPLQLKPARGPNLGSPTLSSPSHAPNLGSPASAPNFGVVNLFVHTEPYRLSKSYIYWPSS